MDRQLFEQDKDVLSHITHDMEVVDRNGDRLGTVERVHFGTTREHGTGGATPGMAERDSDSLTEMVAEAFAPDTLPEEVRERLLRRGFVRVDADGLFASDRYIMPDQIATVAGDQVTLRVTRDELVKR